MSFGTCFVSVHASATGTRPHPWQARALVELLQLLACGEGSAVVAFEHLGRTGDDGALRQALAEITADEARRHAGGCTSTTTRSP
jgi:hypothetical protein